MGEGRCIPQRRGMDILSIFTFTSLQYALSYEWIVLKKLFKTAF